MNAAKMLHSVFCINANIKKLLYWQNANCVIL